MRNIGHIIDHPFLRIKRRIVVIPHGFPPVDFLLKRYIDEGLFPEEFASGIPMSYRNGYLVPIFDHIPEIVTTTPQQLSPRDLDNLSECVPGRPDRMTVYRFTPPEAPEAETRATSRQYLSALTATLQDANLLDGRTIFLGLSRSRARELLKFFIPVHQPFVPDSPECPFLGVGIYVTDSLGQALAWAGEEGAVMVFDIPDLGQIEVWRAEGKEWVELVKSMLISGYGRAPECWHKADLIIGKKARGLDRLFEKRPLDPVPDEEVEMFCFRGFKAFEALRRGLKGIVFLEG
ncbi:hypothetical protein BJ508DRAFT_179931 [Ascobolus immersus RN42]|uniref:Uncharacterized protein n=1 Tax=Ascobolus immersus RN42 TaxID=1160509 RepID=A0A3N4HYH6_ASCIM|nr:hypothetical protein BJ508DRAFT_179931 [Ascobolus immersus RN42]